MPGRLILCATPIGNLEDAPPRLRRLLEEADLVYAEDTRRSRTLLQALGVSRPLRSYFVGNEEERAAELEERLARDEVVALLTDAGTPAVADPGLSAVRAARRAGAEVTVVPGPSAVTAALAVSGLPSERFVFEGFLPRKASERKARLAELAGEERTMVIFSATSRVHEDLRDLARALGDEREVTVARELTKLHEEVWHGSLGEAARRWSEPRGEFTLVVAGAPPPEPDVEAAVARAEELMAEGISLSESVRRAAQESGVSRRGLYERMVRRS